MEQKFREVVVLTPLPGNPPKAFFSQVPVCYDQFYHGDWVQRLGCGLRTEDVGEVTAAELEVKLVIYIYIYIYLSLSIYIYIYIHIHAYIYIYIYTQVVYELYNLRC